MNKTSTVNVETAHQKVIREKKKRLDKKTDYPKPDIKLAECREITKEEAKTIILEYEWLGTMGITQHHYGIFFDNVLAGTICFGFLMALSGYGKYVGQEFGRSGIQLSRGACAWWAHPHSASKLIGYGLKEVSNKGYKYCIAYSDHDAGEVGTVYQATNWTYIGKQPKKHWDLYYKDTGKIYLNDRSIYKKFGFCGKKQLTEWAQDKPEYEIRLRKSKGRYIQLLGDKREKRKMNFHLSKHIEPYPKRK